MMRFLPLIPCLLFVPMLAACGQSASEPKHNWSNYEHYEDNDAAYTAPQGFGFCAGEMAICE